MQIFFRSSKRKSGIKGSSSDDLFDAKLSMVQDTNFFGYRGGLHLLQVLT